MTLDRTTLQMIRDQARLAAFATKRADAPGLFTAFVHLAHAADVADTYLCRLESEQESSR